MSASQVRLPDALAKELGYLVNKGLYSSKSDAIRDAVRKLVLENQIGTIKNTGNSVAEVRKIRKKLSREKFSLKEINKLNH